MYEIIFCERSKEYRTLLRLDEKDKTRRTFYSEIITLIASFEHAIAVELRAESDRLGHKLSITQADAVIERVSASPMTKPLVEMARTKMASRDFGLRGIVHDNARIEGHAPIPLAVLLPLLCKREQACCAGSLSTDAPR